MSNSIITGKIKIIPRLSVVERYCTKFVPMRDSDVNMGDGTTKAKGALNAGNPAVRIAHWLVQYSTQTIISPRVSTTPSLTPPTEHLQDTLPWRVYVFPSSLPPPIDLPSLKKVASRPYRRSTSSLFTNQSATPIRSNISH
jgi:hypothetical protein